MFIVLIYYSEMLMLYNIEIRTARRTTSALLYIDKWLPYSK